MKGHRITLIGWNGKETWLLDPMAPKGTGYTGEPIPWSVIQRAWWPGEQLWFAEGMFRKPPRIKVRDKVPNGRWSLPRGSRFLLRSGENPRVIVRKFITAETKSGHFNQLVEIILKDGSSLGEFIRVSGGNLNGMLIPNTKSLTLNPRPAAAGGSKASGTSGSKKQTDASPASKPAVNATSPEFLAGQQQQYDAIKKHVGPAVILPPRPK